MKSLRHPEKPHKVSANVPKVQQVVKVCFPHDSNENYVGQS
jgi:hypothetical protein